MEDLVFRGRRFIFVPNVLCVTMAKYLLGHLWRVFQTRGCVLFNTPTTCFRIDCRVPWHISLLEFIPGHALHEQGLQRQIGGGTLVSSQERRALVVLRLNRWFCSSVGLHRNSFVRASGESSRRVLFDGLESKGNVQTPGRIDPSAPPRPAVSPCAAPLRPMVCPGFGVDRLFKKSKFVWYPYCSSFF